MWKKGGLSVRRKEEMNISIHLRFLIRNECDKKLEMNEMSVSISWGKKERSYQRLHSNQKRVNWGNDLPEAVSLLKPEEQ